MIIDIIFNCMKEKDPLDRLIEKLRGIYISQDEEMWKKFRNEWNGEGFNKNLILCLQKYDAEDQGSQSISNFGVGAKRSLDLSIRSYITDLLFFKKATGCWIDEDGFWYISEKMESDIDVKNLKLLKQNIDIAISNKDSLLLEDNFTFLVKKMLDNNTHNRLSVGTFSASKLMSIGMIKENKNFAFKMACETIDNIKKSGVCFQSNYFLSFLNSAIKLEDKSLFNGLIELYGDVGRSDNFLLAKAIMNNHVNNEEALIDWLIPKLKCFDIKDSSFLNSNLIVVGDEMQNDRNALTRSAYAFALQYDVSINVMDKLNLAQELLVLKNSLNIRNVGHRPSSL